MRHRLESDIVHVWLSIGSNLGDRAGTIRLALDAIDRIPNTHLASVSSLYATEPVGVTEQPEFLNCAAGCATKLSPTKLLQSLQEIEQRLGRVNRQRWHEREIDIDLLLYGDHVVKQESLTIPHPEMHRRRFVLVPLAEIAPLVRHPIIHQTISELLAHLEDHSSVCRLDESALTLPDTDTKQTIT